MPLKEKWYQMIESLIKPEEYRAITAYWIVRLFRDEYGRKISRPIANFLARLEQFESDYLLHRIDVENYMRQRSLLIQKKNKIITKKEHDKVRYEFIKIYKA